MTSGYTQSFLKQKGDNHKGKTDKLYCSKIKKFWSSKVSLTSIKSKKIFAICMYPQQRAHIHSI